jgi:hypothetical protein
LKRDLSTVLAVDNGNRNAPISLPTDKPVSDSVLCHTLSCSKFFELLYDLLGSLWDLEAIESFTAVGQHTLIQMILFITFDHLRHT